MIARVLVSVAVVHSEPEAEMLAQRLGDAGLDFVTRSGDLSAIGAGSYEIFVEDDRAEEARELLEAPEISEEELAELADEAGREYGTPEA
jgi:hypothetical protein